MKKNTIKDIIDELIYENVVGRSNPFQVGDLVKLHPNVVNGSGPNIQWRQTLEQLLGKVGKISRVFPDSKHINVKYDQPWKSKDEHGKEYSVDTIGVDYTQLIPANNPQKGFGEGCGWGMPKDIAKDPKHTTNKITGKNQRWTVKFQSSEDLKKHGNTEKSPVNESFEQNGRTPAEPMKLTNMILSMGSGESVIFFTNQGNRGPMIHIVRRPSQAGQQVQSEFVFDVEDQKKKKQIITQQSQVEKLADSIVKQKLTRYMGNYQTPTYPKTKGSEPISNPQVTSGQLKEVIKELIDEVEIGFNQKRLKKNINEGDPTLNKEYIIWAKSGPATVYFVDSQSQGPRMVQNAQSMATRFPSEEVVRNKILQLKQKYPGIKKFDFEIVGPKTGEQVWKPHGPKEFELGHQVLKPVKKGDEWIVKWVTNGKIDRDKTYFTDDRKDANDTYELMNYNAFMLNRKEGIKEGIAELSTLDNLPQNNEWKKTGQKVIAKAHDGKTQFEVKAILVGITQDGNAIIKVTEGPHKNKVVPVSWKHVRPDNSI